MKGLNTKTRVILYIIGGALACLLLAAVIFVLTFDINTYRSRIEAAASEVTGMKVHVGGAMRLAIFPPASLALQDVHMQNAGMDVALAEKVEVRIDPLSLLRRQVAAREIRLTNPKLLITKDKRGRFTLFPENESSRPFEMGKIITVGGYVSYRDEATGGQSEATGCDLTIQNISAGAREFLKTLSFDAQVVCKEMKTPQLRISNIRMVIKAREGKFEANPFTAKIFDGEGKGSALADVTGESPKYLIDLTITGFRFEKIPEALKERVSIRGEMNLDAHLTMNGKNAHELTQTLRGDVSLRGQDLFLENLDLDTMLAKYRKTQSTSLFDVGAFLVAGPLGTGLMRGYEFGSLLYSSQASGGETSIRKLVSDWNVRNGVAEAKDVAFTTKKNRIALRGRLDFVHDRYEDVTIAALNQKGCDTYHERVRGTFATPQIEKVSPLRTLVGPILSLAKRPVEILEGDKCEVFYHGSLAQPEE